MIRSITLLLLWSLASLVGAHAAEGTDGRFVGASSCSTSGCHGGGDGHNQFLLWSKKDVHTRAHAILASGRSAGIAEKLGIKDAPKSARCTACHSPLQSVNPDLFVEHAKPDIGVACETCHGPAERWLRAHTRPDYTHEMRLAAGMRDVGDDYARANVCVACHQVIEQPLLDAGHPPMIFELDEQMALEPPHWKDTGTWLGPRAWLTGQAVALREISWGLTKKPGDAELQPRWQALVWLLRKTDSGKTLPEGGAAGEMQSASDRLARSAAKETWSKDSTLALLRKVAGLGNEFRDAPKGDVIAVGRRGEVVTQAVARLWAALKSEGKLKSENIDTSITALGQLARAQGGFDNIKFAAALEQVEVGLELLGKP
jgi:hypothetical protein